MVRKPKAFDVPPFQRELGGFPHRIINYKKIKLSSSANHLQRMLKYNKNIKQIKDFLILGIHPLGFQEVSSILDHLNKIRKDKFRNFVREFGIKDFKIYQMEYWKRFMKKFDLRRKIFM